MIKMPEMFCLKCLSLKLPTSGIFKVYYHMPQLKSYQNIKATLSQALTRETYTQVIQVVNFLCYKYPTFGWIQYTRDIVLDIIRIS